MVCCLLPAWKALDHPQVKSQNSDIKFLPEPLSALSRAAETKLDSTASHESSAKATLPASHTSISPPRLCFLRTLPLTSGGKKKEKGNGFPPSWSIFLLPPSLAGSSFYHPAGTSDSPNSPQIHLLFLSSTFPNMPLHSTVWKSMTETTDSARMKHEVAQVRDGESFQVCSKRKVNRAARKSNTMV